MLFLEIMAALAVGLLAWGVGLLYALRMEGAAASRRTPHQSPAATASPQGEAFEGRPCGGGLNCGCAAISPSVSFADSSLVRGSQGGAADSRERAEETAERKYTQGVLNVLNYSAEDARKEAAER